MRLPKLTTPAVLFGLAVVPSVFGQTTLVNDTWLDGDRTQQEAGTDTDTDGNIESAWFGNSGTLTASTGHLTGTVGSGSSSWTTYFTAEGSEVTLANAGDSLNITWVFSLTGTNATNTSQGFRIALVDSPSGARVSSDTAPGSAVYAGYGMFLNIGQTLGHTNPFALMERTDNTTSSALLSSSGSWTTIDDQENSGEAGYIDSTTYTFSMTITRNATSGLDISATMAGGTVGDDGLLQAAFTDTTPNSIAFDTFSLRPSSNTLSASTFDTTLFRVTVSSVPEPSTYAALLGLGVMGFAAWRRRRRSA